ncbi:transglycosylase family protein [Streptomyces sp. NPDC051569]|uniref:LysM peptidoglycan-binding domain-containing protein n=1 Tax=Streptomyces sp. NPDC051569 TaxID=3365661 RepID=UPI0037BC55A0
MPSSSMPFSSTASPFTAFSFMSSSLAKRSVEAGLCLLLILLSVLGFAGRSTAAVVRPSGPSGTDWERVADCESNGRWHINTGNGYHGGLQIAPSTWRAYGGQRYAPRADLASRDEQIAVGERIVQDRGLSAWPTCGRRGAAGRPGSTTSGSAPYQPPPTAHEPTRRPHNSAGSSGSLSSSGSSGSSGSSNSGSADHASGGSGALGGSDGHTYVVERGDCLSVIAQRADVPGGTEALYELNKDILDEGPDHIYPGQRLRLHA